MGVVSEFASNVDIVRPPRLEGVRTYVAWLIDIMGGTIDMTNRTPVEDRPLSTPNPDPTILTTEALLREVNSLRETMITRIEGVREVLSTRIEGNKTFYEAGILGIHSEMHSRTTIFDSKISGQHDLFGSRLDGMEKAVMLLQSISDRIPAQMDDKVRHLLNLHQEKFDSIQVQFVERDVRTEQTAAGVKIAVDAALQAAKEAVGEQNRSFALATAKSEAATTKQIDAQALSIQTAYKGLDDKIVDMKDRLTRIEGMDLGAARSREGQHSEREAQQGDNKNIIAIIAACLAAFALIMNVFHVNSATPPLVATVPASPPMLQRQSYEFQPTQWPPFYRIGDSF